MSRRFLDDASRPQASRPGGSEEQDPLITLVDIGRALASQLDLRQALERALEYLERDCSIVRAAVLMLDEESGDIRIEVSLGFSAEARHARYRLGEGITGRVVESGHPIVVPAMSREPLFLHRSTERRGDQTLICVPISVEHEPAGALAVDLEYRASRDYDAALRFFTVVASMMAQDYKARRSIGQSRKKLLDENRHLLLQLQHRYDLSGIVGNSGPMRQVCEQIARLAPTDGTVLIRGERGSGKELIAETIHYSSRRARKPLVKVRLAGLPDTAAESVLFGQVESAPTGAPAPRRGSFEMAEGGTLFLDDVCQLNGVTQAKLLRALQEREFERMGGSDMVKTNVRLVAATSRNLEERLRSGLFREDLYYRLNVVPIFLPPLRDRESDIMLLVDHF
ncbi:MAG: sigma 54-interacting transcriptional regulator, partial [Myxococcales bacterium]